MPIQEKTRTVASGYLALVVLPLLTAGIVWMLVRSVMAESVLYIKMKVSERGMIWETMENQDGEYTTRLLPD